MEQHAEVIVFVHITIYVGEQYVWREIVCECVSVAVGDFHIIVHTL